MEKIKGGDIVEMQGEIRNDTVCFNIKVFGALLTVIKLTI